MDGHVCHKCNCPLEDDDECPCEALPTAAPPASAPVTLWRHNVRDNEYFARYQATTLAKSDEEYRALPAPEFDRMERERDAAVALLKEVRTLGWIHKDSDFFARIDRALATPGPTLFVKGEGATDEEAASRATLARIGHPADETEGGAK